MVSYLLLSSLSNGNIKFLSPALLKHSLAALATPLSLLFKKYLSIFKVILLNFRPGRSYGANRPGRKLPD